jgi:RNase P subunit RPR2
MDQQVEERPPEPEPKLEYIGVVTCAHCGEQIGTSYLRGRVVVRLSLWYPGVWGSGEMFCRECGKLTRVPFRARRGKHF